MKTKAMLAACRGHVTRQDRRRLAAGLADGLTYAEIARRYDRPTSVISRAKSSESSSPEHALSGSMTGGQLGPPAEHIARRPAACQ